MLTRKMKRAYKSVSKGGYAIVRGDSLTKLRYLPDNSVDSIVTDPPYGIEFMGKEWDSPRWMVSAGADKKTGLGERSTPWVQFTGDGTNPTCALCGGRKRGKKVCECSNPDWRVKGRKYDPRAVQRSQSVKFQQWCEAWLREALRVLKPGGHLVAFGGTRMWHRLASAVEDAGFEIRDCLMFMHGQGFPKSMSIAKAIDKAARGVPQGSSDPTSVNHGKYRTQKTEGRRSADDKGSGYGAGPGSFMQESGVTQTRKLVRSAQPWEGWGTALKPAMEPIVLARKPFDQPTAAKNVMHHGTGALNIDGCRVGISKDVPASVRRAKQNQSYGYLSNAKGDTSGFDPNTGRWPANIVMQHNRRCVDLDGTHACVPGCPVRMLDDQTGVLKSGKGARKGRTSKGHTASAFGEESRKAGAEMVSYPDTGGASRFFYVAKPKKKERNAGMPDGEENRHPTLKSIDLMRWLCRLVTPPGGIVLDPFVGSGTTACAAVLEGFRVIGVEQDKTFSQTAEWRTAHWAKERR